MKVRELAAKKKYLNAQAYIRELVRRDIESEEATKND